MAVVLGFASGLPLALTGQAMQAWLTTRGVDIATIGFLSLVGVPYTFKFLWAPLMDRFDVPGAGRRRGWLVLTQVALAGALYVLSQTDPGASIRLFALLAAAVAFLSASHDVVNDAYRTDMMKPAERGLGASLNVMGYRLAMILSGGIALIWTDPAQGGGWIWPEVYRFMALLMLGAALLSAFALPPLPAVEARAAGSARRDLLGFAAVGAAVALGVVLSDRFAQPLAQALLGGWLAGTALPPALQQRWVDLAALLGSIAFTLPLAAWGAKVARFETLLGGLRSYFAQEGAAAFLLFIVLYKLGDAFAGSLMTAVPAQEHGLHLGRGGRGQQGAGAVADDRRCAGRRRADAAHRPVARAVRLRPAAAGQQPGFLVAGANGKGVLPGMTIPAFDWGFVKLAAPTPVDGGLLMVVAFENLSGGMGTAAFVAFLMSLCNRRFTATQYALLSAFASVGRVWVGPLAGVLAESIGWPSFFVLSTVLAAPALLMLWWLKPSMKALEAGS